MTLVQGQRERRTSAPERPADDRSGPERFRPAAPQQEPPSWMTRLACGLALLALVVGVPLALWLTAGPPPIPTRLPELSDVTQSLGPQQLLSVLLFVVWLAWLQFVCCVAVELLAAVRGGALPRLLPFAGANQRFARLLVGGVLLSGLVGGQVALVANAVAQPAPVSVSQTSSADAARRAPATMTGAVSSGVADLGASLGSAAVGSTGSSTSGGADAGRTQLVTDATKDLVGKRVYTVEPPVGRHHDSLWDIAQRYLGDGRRYHEIYDLNKDRVQPDGRALHLERLIQPGWELVMPDDATGVARVVAAPATPAPGSAAEPAAAAATGAAGAATGAAGAAHAASVTGLQAQGSTAPGGAGAQAQAGNADPTEQSLLHRPNPVVAGFASGGLFAACLLLALGLNRRRATEAAGAAAEAEIGLRLGADLDRARWLDAALRALAGQCEVTGTPLPQVYAATLDDDGVTLRLSPAAPAAPSPWEVGDEGRTWTLTRQSAGVLGTSGAPAPYPALVCLGRDDEGRDVLVDLEAAGGPVQLVGDTEHASQVAGAIAVQLGTAPWADELSVSTFGLPAEVAAVGEDRIHPVSNVGEVADRLSARRVVAGDAVLSGRLGRVGESPEYLVSVTPLDAGVAARLAAATSGARHAYGVVAVGDPPGAQWRVEVDGEGRLRVPLLGVDVVAHRLTEQMGDAVAQAFAETAAQSAARVAPEAITIPPPPYACDDAAFSAATARVGLMGPVQVEATGPLDAGRLDLAREILVLLAAHPDGVHPGVLAASIWPRGVSADVASATVARVREWLGSDPDGSERLRTDAAGRYRLAPSVAVDWYAFCSLVEQAGQATTEKAESDLLRRALRLVRGPVLAGHPVSRYTWLVHSPLERTVEGSVVAASARLAELLMHRPDPEGAATAVEAGLRLAPTSQLLWRRLFEAEHADGGPAAVRAAVARMHDVLGSAGDAVDGETEALIDHLLGGVGPAPAVRLG